MAFGIINIMLIPFLIWSRWNGSALLFDILLAGYVISWLIFIVKEGKN